MLDSIFDVKYLFNSGVFICGNGSVLCFVCAFTMCSGAENLSMLAHQDFIAQEVPRFFYALCIQRLHLGVIRVKTARALEAIMEHRRV